jgi:hypothetical protein
VENYDCRNINGIIFCPSLRPPHPHSVHLNVFRLADATDAIIYSSYFMLTCIMQKRNVANAECMPDSDGYSQSHESSGDDEIPRCLREQFESEEVDVPAWWVNQYEKGRAVDGEVSLSNNQGVQEEVLATDRESNSAFASQAPRAEDLSTHNQQGKTGGGSIHRPRHHEEGKITVVRKRNTWQMSLQSLAKLWKAKFWHVFCVPKSRFTKCDICETLKEVQSMCKSIRTQYVAW